MVPNPIALASLVDRIVTRWAELRPEIRDVSLEERRRTACEALIADLRAPRPHAQPPHRR